MLAESGADLIAFETIPNKLEAKVFHPNALKLTSISSFNGGAFWTLYIFHIWDHLH